MSTVSKEKFTSGVFWKLSEQFGPSLVSLILSMVLARILTPEDYGIIAIANVFIAFSDILVQSGFCESLIQKKDVDKKDYSTATSIGMMIATALYIIVFFTSPFIANFYNMPDLNRILKVLGVLIFINGLSAVMNAYIVRNFKFKLLFVVHMVSSVISAVAGIASAYLGCGVWALVIQKLVQQGIFLVILAIVLKWKFIPGFNKASAKSLVKYGANVLGGAIIAFVSDNSYSIAIGKKYPDAAVGYLSKADQLPQSLIIASSNSLASVTLPTIASINDGNKNRVCQAYSKIMKMIAFIIFPLVVGVFAVADNLITVLFTDKFIECVPLLRALCLFYITVPFLMTAGSAVRAMGNSKIYILSELLKMVATVTLICIFSFAVTIELHWLVLIKGCISVLMCGWTLIFTKHYFGYGLIKHLIDILPSALLSLLMGASAYAIGITMQTFASILSLIVQVIVAVVVYVGASLIATKLWKFTGLTGAWGIVKSLFGRSTRNKEVVCDAMTTNVASEAENGNQDCAIKSENSDKVKILFISNVPSSSFMGVKETFASLDIPTVVTQFLLTKKVKQKDISSCDILFMIRPTDSLYVKIAKMARKSGAFVISFFDDDLMNLPPEYLNYKGRVYCAEKAIRKSDLICSCNPIICEKYYQLTVKKRFALIDSIVENTNSQNVGSRDSRLKLVYAAGGDHKELFENIVLPALHASADKFAKPISLSFVGVHPVCDGIDEKIELQYFDYMPSATYKEFMASQNFDIGLAPLADNPFSACKYFNKYIEYSRYGIVGVYSKVAPYTFAIRDKENGLLVANEIDDWCNALIKAVNEDEWRSECILHIENDIVNKYSVEVVRRKLLSDIPEMIQYRSVRKKVHGLLAGKIRYKIFRFNELAYKTVWVIFHKGFKSLFSKAKARRAQDKIYKEETKKL